MARHRTSTTRALNLLTPPLTSLLGVLAVQPALAQTPATNLEEVVVTGTLLRGVQPVGSAVLSIGQEEIRQAGHQTTTDVLRSLPQVTSIGATEQVTASSANSAQLNYTRANGINLRGLGTTATLTLVDGRRPVPGGTSAQLFDASNIPSLALARVEVVPDGASALYGTDAVAGVVNLLLRTKVNGVEGALRYTSADQYDGRQAGLIAGKTWDSGSALIAGEYFWHSPLYADDRKALFNADFSAYGGRDNRGFLAVPGNILVNNVRRGIPAGQDGVGLTQADLLATPNREDPWIGVTALPEIERKSLVVSADQDLTDSIRLWTTTYAADRHYDGTVAAETRSLVTPSSNPFYVPIVGAPACAASVGAPAGSRCETVEYSLRNDVGVQTRDGRSNSYQAAIGLDFKLPGDWLLKIAGTRGENWERDTVRGALNTAQLNAALRSSNPATAFNPFGQGGANRQLAATMTGFQKRSSQYSRDTLTAKVDGPLFALPGGDVRLAVGAEHIDDFWFGDSIRNDSTANVSIVAVLNSAQSTRQVKSVYAEALIPLVGAANAMPGVERLELDVAGRWDDYSDVGDTSNPKLGLRWDPVSDLTVRASYGKSFRAPPLPDKNAMAGASILTRANFAASGLNVIFPVGGNADLVPETARTWTTGFDYKPKQLAGLTFSATYFDIDYKNIIDIPGALNTAALTDPSFAPLIIVLNRNNPAHVALAQSYLSLPYAQAAQFTGSVADRIIDGRRVNVGRAKMNGVDVSGAYRWSNAAGEWNAGANLSYVATYDYTLVAGGPSVPRVNQINYPLRYRARAQFGWRLDGLSVNAFANYNNQYTNTGVTLGSGAVVDQTIAASTTVDLTAAYDMGAESGGLSNVSIALQAQNLFDKAPPRALVTGTGSFLFDAVTGNPIGRQLSLEIRKRF